MIPGERNPNWVLVRDGVEVVSFQTAVEPLAIQCLASFAVRHVVDRRRPLSLADDDGETNARHSPNVFPLLAVPAAAAADGLAGQAEGFVSRNVSQDWQNNSRLGAG